MLGNNALRNSRSKVYKLCRKIECGMIATRIVKDNPKEASNANSSLRLKNMELNKRKFTPLKMYLLMKLYLKTWLEYSRLKDYFTSPEYLSQFPAAAWETSIEKQKRIENAYFNRLYPIEDNAANSPSSPLRVKFFDVTARILREIMQEEENLRNAHTPRLMKNARELRFKPSQKSLDESDRLHEYKSRKNSNNLKLFDLSKL